MTIKLAPAWEDRNIYYVQCRKALIGHKNVANGVAIMHHHKF
jgi:hypothetical protein